MSNAKLPATLQVCPLPLDLAHLARQTGGDLLLQRELLTLFTQRSPELVALMGSLADDLAQPSAPLRDLAHQLRGSALALGAFGVAAAAEAVERAFGHGPSDGPCPDRDLGAAQIVLPELTAGDASLVALTQALADALAAIEAYRQNLAEHA